MSVDFLSGPQFVVSNVVTQHMPDGYRDAGVKGQIFCFSNTFLGDPGLVKIWCFPRHMVVQH